MDNVYDQFDQPEPSSAVNPYDQFDPPPERRAAAVNPYDQFDAPPPPQQQQQPLPEAEGKLATAGRELAHGVVPGAAGAWAGMAAGAALGSAVPGLGTLAGGIIGGLGGGLLGGYAASTVQESALNALGFDDSLQRAVNAKENPWSSAGGAALSAVAGGGPGALTRAAAPGVAAITGKQALGIRAASGAIGGGFEAGSQLAQGEELDPTRIAATAAGGAAFAKPYAWGNRAGEVGERLGAQWRDRPRAQPHNPAGPTTNASTAAEPVPVSKREDVGDPHNPMGEGSEVHYSKPRDSAIGETDGTRVREVGEPDPTLKAALDAKTPPVQPEAPTPPQEAAVPPPEAAVPPPVAEPPQGVTSGPPVTPPAQPRVTIDPATGQMRMPKLTDEQFAGGIQAMTERQREAGGSAPLPTAGQQARNQLEAGLEATRGRTDDLEIPSFLDRRTPKPATVAEEPAQAGGREIAPAATVGDALKIANAATREFNKAQADYRAQRIGDEEFLAAKAKHDAASRAFDESRGEAAPQTKEQISSALKKARAAEEAGGWRKGGPTYPHASVPRPKLEALIKEADAESSRITKAFIDAGRGHERPTDIQGKTDQLSMDYKAISEWQRGLNEEMRRRLKGHGKRTPLPKEYRDTFYAGESLRRDVVERGPRSGRPTKTEPLSIGSEDKTIEAGLAKVIKPGLPGVKLTSSPTAYPSNENYTARRRSSQYELAVRDQQFQNIKGTAKTFEAWQKIAAEEGHTVTGKPNAYRAAKAHSEGGKTTVLITYDGRRSIFKDGERVQRDRAGDPRATYSVEEPLRQDVIRRSRDGRPLETARLRTDKTEAIIEASLAKATGPKGEPREPEMLAARRKPPKDPDAPDAAIDAAAGAATIKGNFDLSKPVDWNNLPGSGVLHPDGIRRLELDQPVRVYRGEGGTGAGLAGQAVKPGSPSTGGWWTTNLEKAKKYGEVKYLDLTGDDIKHFAQGHGGPDEFVTTNPKFRPMGKPLEAETAPAIDRETANKVANRTDARLKKAMELGVTPESLKAHASAILDGKPPPPLVPSATPSAARGTPSVVNAVGAGGGGPNAGGAGGGGGGLPPNVGAAAAAGAGGGGGPTTPNMGHTPPQQQSWLKELWRDVKRKTAAHTLGPEAMEARYLIRSSSGEKHRLAEQTIDLIRGHKDHIDPMSPADHAALIDHAQGGNHFPNFQPTAEQKLYLQARERAMQEWEAVLHQLPAADQMQFREKYMAQMYENPQAAGGRVFTGMGKRGSAGSTKQRKYDTYMDAEAAGLIRKYNNPIEIDSRYINSIKDFVISRDVVQRGADAGIIQWFDNPKIIGASGSPEPKVTGGPPPGMKELNGVPMKGNSKTAYAPDDFADVYNNFYDKGFGTTPEKATVVEAVRNSANAWTSLELGLNAYHLFTMANEAIITDLTKGFNNILIGQVRKGLKQIAMSPLAPETMRREGKIFQKEYLDPNSTNPIAMILAEANARPIGRGHAADYTFQERGAFINKLSNIEGQLKQARKEIGEDFNKAFGPNATESKILFPLRQAGRILQTTAAPIFDKYIPMLKAGAVHSQFKDWHEAMVAKNPAFDMVNNPADRRTAVNAGMKIVDSVDNRFGEAIHDNAFMNGMLKQGLMTMMRSYSWTVGAMKEIGGGSAAAGQALYTLGKTRGAENRFDMTHKDWDPRMAYPLALMFAVSTISTIYQMLRAGEAPEGWRDLYAPKTGGTVPGVGGKGMVKEHVLMPGYQKDVLGWAMHPAQEAYNKMGGLPTTAIEQLTGKDWRGDPIVRADANALEGFGQRLGHVLGKLSPISLKNMTKGSEPTSAITWPEKAIGFRAPGAHIQDPVGLKRAMDFKDRRIQKAIDKRERKIQLRQNPQQVSP